MITIVTLSFQWSASAQSDVTTRYFYDANGRLVTVVAPNGETTFYQYDAAGNLVSISRQNTAPTVISNFSPGSGLVNSQVRIEGVGFSTAPSQNTVTFNGINAIVASATETEIIAIVPNGATTGQISVTSPNGTAASNNNFVVIPTVQITSFSPSVANIYFPVTINGNGFDRDFPSDNVIRFNNHFTATTESATGQVLTTKVPIGATSGRISVTTPNGTAVSSSDIFIAPPGYSVSQLELTGRVNLGEDKSVTLPGVNKTALLLFEGSQNQKAHLLFSNFTGGYRVKVMDPHGGTLINRTESSPSLILEDIPLPFDGTYTILIQVINGSLTNANVRVELAAPEVTAALVPNGPIESISIAIPRQNARLSFPGQTGQDVTLAVSNNSITESQFTVYSPSGTVFRSGTVNTANESIVISDLPENGTYSVLFNPTGTLTGSADFRLIVLADVTGTITVNGAPLTIANTLPGQNIRVNFTGAAGQRLFLRFTDPEIYGKIAVLAPNGAVIVDNVEFYIGQKKAIDIHNLPSAGIYTIVINPQHETVGNITVAATETATIEIGEPLIPVVFATANQTASLNFTANAGDKINVRKQFYSMNLEIGTFSLYQPDGTLVASAPFQNGIVCQTLPASGTYRIEVTPVANATGKIFLELSYATITSGGGCN